MNSKKIAVTGATGLVGSHLVAELLARGCRDIILTVRDASRIGRMTATLEREGVDYSDARFEVVEAGLTNPIELKEAFEGADIVFNCAAQVSLGAMDDNVLIEGNMWMARHVVNACLAAGVGKLVHVSSVAAVGDAPEGVQFIDETMVHESIADLPSYYAGKLLAENEVMRGAAEGLRTVVVNPTLILGAGDWRTGSTAMIPTMASGTSFYTDGVTGMVDVRDVARAMVELAGREDAVGERFILCGENMPYREFLTRAAQAAGKKPPGIRLGGHALGFAWRAAKLSGKITGTKTLFTREIAEVLQKKTYYSSDKVKNMIGFAFTPIGDTIERIVKQYLDEKNGRQPAKNG